MMNKSICFLLVLVIVAIVASHNGVEADGYGVCGKFSPDRMVTHVLRHCEKAARDVKVPVSPNCCAALSKVSDKCLYAVVHSNAFKKAGINPQIAFTIPKRCHIHH